MRNKQPLLVPDVDTCQDIQPDLLPGELAFKAYVGLPLLAGDDLIGTLVLIHNQVGVFGEEDLQLLESLAGQAAVAIRNAQLFEEVERNARRLATLNAVAAVINQPLPLQEMIDQAIAKVIEVMETDAGGVRLYDQATGDLVIASFQGLEPEDIQRIRRLNLGEGFAAQLAQFREPLVVRDLKQVPQLADIADYGFGTHVYVPVMVKGKTVGVLGVITRRTREFASEELDLLTAIGHQIGVAVENTRLRQQALDAERLAAVGRVATSVAHDLRSPLGGITRSAEFLARPELSDGTRQELSRAVVALAHRLINTTQEILDYTRGGRMDLRLTTCALPEFLEQVIEVLKVDFSDRGIEVLEEWNYTGRVRMDSDRMAQVVYNIAANARDAMPEGGRLTIATHRVDEWVELSFTDTGHGVPPELVERIFEPFISYGKREGAGLGLAIARRIVQEHGGEIGVESPARGGATFRVRLPLGE